MKNCEFCGAGMINEVGFCGSCGRLPSRISQHATQFNDIPTLRLKGIPRQNDEDRAIPDPPVQHATLHSPSGALHPITLIPLDKEDDEEEKRKRAALFDAGLPLLDEIANRATVEQLPVIQGTPQIAHVPVLPNTPQIVSTPTIPGTPPLGAMHGPGAPIAVGQPLLLPHVQPPQPLPAPVVRPIELPQKPASQPPRSFSGCLPLGAIFLATILIILVTSVGLSLTAFAPGLSISGGSIVAPGGKLTLHGHNFLPQSSVALTLDNGISVPIAQSPLMTPAVGQHSTSLTHTELALDMSLTPATHNTISTRSDGTFTVTIPISATWTPGHHTIHAAEAVSHRSASLPFSISQATATATPTATPTPIPTATPSPTPTATITPPPGLSCVTPGTLALGPISAFSSQVTSGSVTLCTTGTGTLTWRAGWNQNQAPWLQMKQTSGSIQAPNQVQITISASATKLAAGTYTATVTFTGVESSTTRSVTITLTVKAGCVNANPQSLSFSGVEGASDPDGSQNVSITNCGMTNTWSATIDNGSSWLSLSSNKGTLQSGASKTIAVTASNLNAELKAGTYHDSITFTIDSVTATVRVTLTVQSASPTISVSPNNLNAASSPCTNDDGGNNLCTVTLTNNSSTTALTWSANSDGNGVTVQADSTTISAGGSEQVTISIPTNNCGTALTITFKAPGNSASVTWNCTPISPPS